MPLRPTYASCTPTSWSGSWPATTSSGWSSSDQVPTFGRCWARRRKRGRRCTRRWTDGRCCSTCHAARGFDENFKQAAARGGDGEDLIWERAFEQYGGFEGDCGRRSWAGGVFESDGCFGLWQVEPRVTIVRWRAWAISSFESRSIVQIWIHIKYVVLSSCH